MFRAAGAADLTSGRWPGANRPKRAVITLAAFVPTDLLSRLPSSSKPPAPLSVVSVLTITLFCTRLRHFNFPTTTHTSNIALKYRPQLSYMYSLLALGLGATAALAQSSTGGEGHAGGSFEDGGNTQVSAMMASGVGFPSIQGTEFLSSQMFLGNEETVYILDKVEGNAVKFGNYPAVGAVYDIASRTATPIGVTSNPFCASGAHMPNGSYIAFGGNSAVGPGGDTGDVNGGSFDSTYGDEAGQTGVRVMNPLTCSGSSAATDAACQWYDDYNVTHLISKRWYSTAEALGDGTVAVIGGFTSGGYINRNWPNDNDPVYQGGASSPTYEFWPSTGATPPVMQFLVDAGGLNSYPLTYLLASGNMVLQANVSTSGYIYLSLVMFSNVSSRFSPLGPSDRRGDVASPYAR